MQAPFVPLGPFPPHHVFGSQNNDAAHHLTCHVLMSSVPLRATTASLLGGNTRSRGQHFEIAMTVRDGQARTLTFRDEKTNGRTGFFAHESLPQVQPDVGALELFWTMTKTTILHAHHANANCTRDTLFPLRRGDQTLQESLVAPPRGCFSSRHSCAPASTSCLCKGRPDALLLLGQ